MRIGNRSTANSDIYNKLLCCFCLFRYQLFLQVKQDVLQGRLPVSFELAAELGAFIVQCKCSLSSHITHIECGKGGIINVRAGLLCDAFNVCVFV